MTDWRLYRTVEHSMLLVYSAWENFIEDSFRLLLQGVQPVHGLPCQSYVNAVDDDHAYQILLADRRSDYVDWTVADQLLQRAGRFFKGGEPFYSAIQPKTTRLDQAKTIRNAIAHSSPTAVDKFLALARRRGAPLPCDPISPGQFLLLPPPSSPASTFFDQYVRVVESAAAMIAPLS